MMSEMTAKIEGLEKELSATREELSATKERIQSLDSGNMSAEEEIAKLRSSFEEERDKNRQLGEQMEQTLKKNASREKKLMM